MSFNKQLKRYREFSGMTQQMFAEKLNVTLRAYQNYEQGHREPSFDILVKIADILNVTTDELLGRNTEK